MAGSNLPVFVRGTGSDAIASYDWLDVTSGVGYRRYYLAGDYVPAYSIVTRAIDSATGGSSKTLNITGLAASKHWDTNFDIVMNVPSYIKGIAYFNFTHDASVNINHRYFVITVYHDDGTPTSIGTAKTTDRGVDTSIFRELVAIDLTGKKFAKGDILRVNVQIWLGEVGGNATTTLYFDPASLLSVVDKDGRTVGTDFNFDCPFNIDLT